MCSASWCVCFMSLKRPTVGYSLIKSVRCTVAAVPTVQYACLHLQTAFALVYLHCSHCLSALFSCPCQTLRTTCGVCFFCLESVAFAPILMEVTIEINTVGPIPPTYGSCLELYCFNKIYTYVFFAKSEGNEQPLRRSYLSA